MMKAEPGLTGIDGDIDMDSNLGAENDSPRNVTCKSSNKAKVKKDTAIASSALDIIEGIEEEHRCDILRGAFDFILYKIEQKGRRHKIMKFEKMHELRQSRNSKEILK